MEGEIDAAKVSLKETQSTATKVETAKKAHQFSCGRRSQRVAQLPTEGTGVMAVSAERPEGSWRKGMRA